LLPAVPVHVRRTHVYPLIPVGSGLVTVYHVPHHLRVYRLVDSTAFCGSHIYLPCPVTPAHVAFTHYLHTQFPSPPPLRFGLGSAALPHCGLRFTHVLPHTCRLPTLRWFYRFGCAVHRALRWFTGSAFTTVTLPVCVAITYYTVCCFGFTFASSTVRFTLLWLHAYCPTAPFAFTVTG